MSEAPKAVEASGKEGLSFLVVIAAAVLISAVFSGITVWYVQQQRTEVQASVAVLDSNLIFKKHMEKLLAAETNPQIAAENGKKLATQLNSILAEYSAQGIVVVNSAIALSYPSSLDVTKDVAQRLGVHLD